MCNKPIERKRKCYYIVEIFTCLESESKDDDIKAHYRIFRDFFIETRNAFAQCSKKNEYPIANYPYLKKVFGKSIQTISKSEPLKMEILKTKKVHAGVTTTDKNEDISTPLQGFVENSTQGKLEDRFKVTLDASILQDQWHSPNTPYKVAKISFKKDLTEVLSLAKSEEVMNYDIFFKMFSLALGVERTPEEKQSTLETIIDHFKKKEVFKSKLDQMYKLRSTCNYNAKLTKLLKILNTNDYTPQDGGEVPSSGNSPTQKKDLQIFSDFFDHLKTCSKENSYFYHNTVRGKINGILSQMNKKNKNLTDMDPPLFKFKNLDKNVKKAKKNTSKAHNTEDKKNASKKRTSTEMDNLGSNSVDAINNANFLDKNNGKRNAKFLEKEQKKIVDMHEKTADLGQTKMMDRLENNGDLQNFTHGPSELYPYLRDPRVDYTSSYDPNNYVEEGREKLMDMEEATEENPVQVYLRKTRQAQEESELSDDLAYTITVGSTIDAKKTEGKNKTNTLGHQKFIDEDY